MFKTFRLRKYVFKEKLERICNESGSVEKLSSLLNRHSRELDIDFCNVNGDTPMMMAARNGYEDCVCLLMDSGADVAIGNSLTGETLSLLVAQRGMLLALEKLIAAKKLDLDFIEKIGTSPLLEIARIGNIRTLSAVLSSPGVRDSHLNQRDKDGNTMLHFCCSRDETQMASLLLQRGANRFQRSARWQLPFELSRSAEMNALFAEENRESCEGSSDADSEYSEVVSEADPSAVTAWKFEKQDVFDALTESESEAAGDYELKERIYLSEEELLRHTKNSRTDDIHLPPQILAPMDLGDKREDGSFQLNSPIQWEMFDTELDQVIRADEDVEIEIRIREGEDIEQSVSPIVGEDIGTDLVIQTSLADNPDVADSLDYDSISTSSSAINNQRASALTIHSCVTITDLWTQASIVASRFLGRWKYRCLQRMFYRWSKYAELDDCFSLNSNDEDYVCDNSSTDVEDDLFTEKLRRLCENFSRFHSAACHNSLRLAWRNISEFSVDWQQVPLPLPARNALLENESALWSIFSFYCKCPTEILSKNHPQWRSKRLLTQSDIWSLLHDFGVCPDVCNKLQLFEMLAKNCSGKSVGSQVILSFNGFNKLLWSIAVKFLEIANSVGPYTRTVILLRRMDTSEGRQRLSRARNSRIIPHFHLSEMSADVRAARLLSS